MRRRKSCEIKIAYIGGGSRSWAHVLMCDLALCQKISGHLSLYDIDHPSAQSNALVGQDIFSRKEARTTFKVTAAPNPATALRGADFVICSIEPGPTRMRYADLEIPARYGILQTVGDTVGPGGLMRSLRSVPIMMHYARLIMRHCPKAWVINYTNPMTICVSALYHAEPSIKALGCCHEVFGTQWYLASKVEKWFGIDKPDRREISLDIAGVNHFTFATAASWRGHDLFPRLRSLVGEATCFRDRTRAAVNRLAKQQWFSSDKLVALDFLRRFGALGAAGDRHLAEFVPWYLGSDEQLHRWGVIRTPYAWRLERSRQGRRSTTFHQAALAHSDEEGVRQICALLGMEAFTTNVNLPNRGQLTDALPGAVVESYARFSRDAIRPVVSGPLPASIRTLMDRIISVQQMTLRAAATRDRELAFQALLLDPLVRLPTDKAWRMFNEMVTFTRKMLPG